MTCPPEARGREACEKASGKALRHGVPQLPLHGHTWVSLGPQHSRTPACAVRSQPLAGCPEFSALGLKAKQLLFIFPHSRGVCRWGALPGAFLTVS